MSTNGATVVERTLPLALRARSRCIWREPAKGLQQSIGTAPTLAIISSRNAMWRRVSTSPSITSAFPMVLWAGEGSTSVRINSGMHNIIQSHLYWFLFQVFFWGDAGCQGEDAYALKYLLNCKKLCKNHLCMVSWLFQQITRFESWRDKHLGLHDHQSLFVGPTEFHKPTERTDAKIECKEFMRTTKVGQREQGWSQ